MKQKLILLALVMGLTIVSQSSLSLGMGKIQVYSALNEPLQSSIDLLANTEEELLNLEVNLASSEDYQKVGLDKSFVPANIMVSFDEENPYQINVTSNGPVSEPIVSLLLDVNWNNGRILREFTVLLDPPVYESTDNSAQINSVLVEPIDDNTVDNVVVEEPVAVVTEPELQERESQTQTVTNADFAGYEEQAEAVAEEATPVYSSSSLASEVYVESGDTLWRIANNNKVGDLSAQQMMMAIYNKNPSAFIDNNINKLIKGSRLAMPSLDEADDLGFSEAMAQVESHHQSWAPEQQDYNTYQTEAATEDDYQAPESTLDYGVQLSGGDNQDGSDGGQSNADQGTAADAQAIEEDLYNKDAENSELKERISELEGIVEQQQDAIQISDDGLANLENQLDTAADETAEVIDDTVDTTAATADDIWDAATDATDEAAETDEQSSLSADAVEFGSDDTTDSESTSLADVDSETASQTEDTAQVDTTQNDTAAITETPAKYTPAKQQSFIDTAISWVMGNLMWVLIGLGALIALLIVPKLIGGGGDDEEEDGTSFLDDIKNRKAAKEEAAIDQAQDEDDDYSHSAETKMNKPLAEDIDAAEDDVLAELDSSIGFDESAAENSDSGMDSSEDDELTELNEAGEFETVEDDDGFDLDGFLNDENDDITETKDHSETLANVSFDDEDEVSSSDEDNDSEDDDEDDDEDMSFDDLDLDLDLDDDIEELSDEVEETAEDLVTDTQEAADEVADKSAEPVDQVGDEAAEFSFDDEDFDFNLDDELEELSNEDDAQTAESEVATATESESEDEDEESEDFNDMLDISDEDAETFEIIEEGSEAGMDEEIDLGLEDLMDDSDAIDTKLDLAKAYIDMGDSEGAKNLLDEIVSEGTDEQIAEAKKLMDGNKS